MKNTVIAFISGLTIGAAFFTLVASAWTGPTATAPGNNVAAPVNVGSASQTKNGFLQINNTAYNNNSFSVVGNLILTGTGNYLNFGSTWGTAGYGIRDNGGTLQFKNSGDVNWQSLQTIVYNYIAGSGQWTMNSSNIYYNGGNVGIGVTNPTSLLTVGSPAEGNAFQVGVAGDVIVSGGSDSRWGLYHGAISSPTEVLAIEPSNQITIKQSLEVGSPVPFDNVSGAVIQAYGNGVAGLAVYEVNQAGSAVSFLNPNGRVGFIGTYGGSTSYNTTSDRRLKENIATTTTGLATLLQIPVDNFDFINDPAHTQVQGFIAQTLENIYPEAVTTNGDNGIVPLGASSTPWSVDYGRITPLIVAAVQDIANITSTFRQNLIAWLGDAANGIHNLYATVIHSQENDTQRLCVGSTCVTPAQFQAMVAAANPSAAASSTACTSSASVN